MREQIYNLATELREFMQFHEIERYGTEIDINVLLDEDGESLSLRPLLQTPC